MKSHPVTRADAFPHGLIVAPGCVARQFVIQPGPHFAPAERWLNRFPFPVWITETVPKTNFDCAMCDRVHHVEIESVICLLRHMPGIKIRHRSGDTQPPESKVFVCDCMGEFIE